MRLTKREKQALDKSIRKWKRVVRGAEEHGATDCALCDLYFTAKKCDGRCPIKRVTGQDHCQGTPYQQWLNLATESEKKVFRAVGHEQRKAATAMLNFLRAIRA